MIGHKVVFGSSGSNSALLFTDPKYSFYIEDSSIKPDMEMFKKALLKMNLIDAINSDYYGSSIILPEGKELFDICFNIIRVEYKRFGLKEYDFPSITSARVFDNTKKIFNLRNKLLHVGDDSSFSQNMPLGTLTPTGEQTIYSYLNKTIKTERDLPIKIFKKSTFFRPVSKNKTKSIFGSIEASDVFEFHCAYANRNEQRDELFRFLEMFQEIYRKTYVPVIQVQRPLWTNNHFVSEATYGYDTILPNLKTLQVGSIYDQNQLFSTAYDIGFNKNNNRFNTIQVTGALSRRLILSHLFLGLKTNGTISVHPELAPTQAELIIKNSSEDLGFNLNGIQALFDKKGIRYKCRSGNQNEIKNGLASVSVFIFSKRDLNDKFKILLIRNDNGAERVIFTDNIELIVDLVTETLKAVGYDYVLRQKKFFGVSVSHASNIVGMKSGQKESSIVSVFSEFNNSTVSALEKELKGEVLGFIEHEKGGNCVISGKSTKTIALFAKRL